MNRFRGALVALLALVVVGVVYLVVVGTGPQAPVDDKARLFTFEEEDLVSIRLERADGTLEFTRAGDTWTWGEKQWRPSRSMVRRVAHQTHDLTSRAAVSDPGPLSEYGLGDGAVRVRLGLEDGRVLEFEAGDPNPTSVSWYIRPLPGDQVYTVKKSAVDYWRMAVEDFREDRFAAIDADLVASIEATVDGREMVFKRGESDRWRQTVPVDQAADLQEVRTMIGRTASLRASKFVEDHPKGLEAYGLQPPRHIVRFRAEDGEVITVHVGDVVLGSDPQERYMMRVEDDAVYLARDGFLEAFTKDWSVYRDKRIVGRAESDLAALVVTNPEIDGLRLSRTPDGWRWPDGAKVTGSTPRFLASAASDPLALSFIDAPGEAVVYGLDAPTAILQLDFAEGRDLNLEIGSTFSAPAIGERPPEKRAYLRVQGEPVVYEVEGAILDRVSDLLNEYRKKLETDVEKGLVAPPEPPG